MAEIVLKGVRNYALNGVDLRIRDGETLAIVGLTGAGKTTLIKAIAGLIPYEGTILIDGKGVRSVPIRKRRIGYLPQDLYLFPHMTVFSNVVYGLKNGKTDGVTARRQGESILKLMGITHLADRYPANLSGGEKQRVALARAIAPQPEILLLDEPFSSLDVKTAKYLRLEFKRIVHELGFTTLFITHNLTEAEEMGDRIAIMDRGRILREGNFSDVFVSPDHPLVSEFMGSYTILDCITHQPIGNGLARVETGRLSLIVPEDRKKIRKVAIASRHVYLSTEKPPGPNVNRFRGVVEEIRDDGVLKRLIVNVSGERVLAEVSQGEEVLRRLIPGMPVYVIFRLRHLKVL